MAYGANLFDGEQWTGLSVTEDLLSSVTNKAGILHLAMHGDVEDEHPLLSKLYFNPSGTTDGLLHTYEIYNMHIPAQLVLLSACNTASGKIKRGEGILSLERAFQFAGSNALLATLWTVDDAASSRINQLFLDRLKQGADKDEALRAAKLEYLNSANPENLHPFYWSSFKLSGTTSPIKFSDYNPLYLTIVGIAVFGLILFGAIRLRKRRNR